MKKIIIFLSVAVGLMFLALSCSDDNGQNAAQAGTPAIHNISPALGPAGTKITITGENFGSISDNLVKIGGVTATVTSASDTELVVMVPPGVTSGTLDVTLNGDSDIKGSFTATGKDLEGQLLLNHSELTLYPYPHYAKTLEVIYSDSGNHEEEEIFWESSSENVATVDQNGRVTPLALGTTTITATIGGGANGDVGTCEVSVVDGPVTKLLLDETKLNLYSGDQAQIGIATLKADVQETGLPVWSSDNQDVATVDQQGLVTAIDEGIANITVTVDNASASCQVNVAGNIYVVGNLQNGNGGAAVLWKNGVLYHLTNGQNQSSANAIYVSENNDVYIAGYESVNNIGYARLWVNGNPIDISDGSNNAAALSLFVDGTDVYVGGYETVNGVQVAKVWVNGVSYDYSDGSYDAMIQSIFVEEGIIYATGREDSQNGYMITVWENGQGTQLGRGIGYSIFAEGNDVYVGGSEQRNWPYPQVWVNDNPTEQFGEAFSGTAYSVLVANNNTYASGNINSQAVISTNGTLPVHLPNNGNTSHALSVFVKGTDVYVSGTIEINQTFHPVVWKNGVLMMNLPNLNNNVTMLGDRNLFVK